MTVSMMRVSANKMRTAAWRYVRRVLNERTAQKPSPTTKGASTGATRRVAPMPPTGMWIKWDPKNPFEYDTGERDHGPGEVRLSWELSGELAGGSSVSYDVVDQTGAKWEVKEPDGSKMIRPGIDGKRALHPVREQLEDVCRELTLGFDKLDSKALRAFTVDAPLDPREVANFIKVDVPFIMSGEISAGRIFGGSRTNPIGLLQVLEFIKHMIGDAVNSPPRNVVFGKTTRSVDIGTYVHMARSAGMTDEEIDATVEELFAGTFRHPAFRKPREFIQNVWTDGVRASLVFAETAGVILVTPQKYMLIPQDELDVHLKFARVSKGEPRFALQD